MIFSGSTAGGSGGLRSDLLPERSRRAAAALSWAAIFMGLEMFDVRRRAGAAFYYAALSPAPRIQAGGQHCLPGSGAGPRAVEMHSEIDRSTKRSKQAAARVYGQERRVQCTLCLAGCASVLRPLAPARLPRRGALASSQKRAHRVGRCCTERRGPLPPLMNSRRASTVPRGTDKKETTSTMEVQCKGN